MTSPAVPVERIQKLIALSASSEKEEARTASLLACQLIREHKLVVREKEEWDDLGITKDELRNAYRGVYPQDDEADRVTEEIYRKAAAKQRLETLRKMNVIYGKMAEKEGQGHLDDESLDVIQTFFARFNVTFRRNAPGSYNVTSGLMGTRGATLAQALRFALVFISRAISSPPPSSTPSSSSPDSKTKISELKSWFGGVGKRKTSDPISALEHTRTGNCFDEVTDSVLDDVCIEHEEPRGSCDVCPPCLKCNALSRKRARGDLE